MTDAADSQPSGRAMALGDGAIFPRILCAIEGKEGGFTAVEQAAAICGPQGHLTVVVVTSFRSEGEHRGPAIGPIQAAEIVARATRLAADAGVPCTTEVDPESPPARVILERSSDHDMLALGAPASSWLAGMFKVGVGDSAVGARGTSLLVARRAPGEGTFGDHIVVASDGLAASEPVVEVAKQLARPHGAKLTLVHALGHHPRFQGHRSADQDERLERQREGLQRTLAAEAVETRTSQGPAHDVIVATATEVGASLVVMGSRRLDGLRAFGSVSRHVVHEAPCSVMLVSPEALGS